MASGPPYIPGLPPGVVQHAINVWQGLNRPVPSPPPLVNPSPPPGPNRNGQNPPAAGGDALEGLWATSGGTWRFTKDDQGYSFEEASVLLGITGQGRANCQNGTVQVACTSFLLGHVTYTLHLSADVMSGYANLFGIAVPIHSQRI